MLDYAAAQLSSVEEVEGDEVALVAYATA